MTSRMHTQLCEGCLTVKRTGITMDLYNKWLREIGARTAIERSVTTLSQDVDLGLLNDKICFECSLGNYEDGSGIEVDYGT